MKEWPVPAKGSVVAITVGEISHHIGPFGRLNITLDPRRL